MLVLRRVSVYIPSLLLKGNPTCCFHIDSTYGGQVINYIPQISKPDTEHMVYLPTFGYLFMVYVGK